MVKPIGAVYDGNLGVCSSWDIKKKNKKKHLTMIVNILL